jgi:transposase-like protein
MTRRGHRRTYYFGQAQPRCPHCGGTTVAKAGHDYSRQQGGIVQRWKCKSCGRSFIFGKAENYD